MRFTQVFSFTDIFHCSFFSSYETDLPGFDKEAIELSLRGHNLIISAAKDMSKDENSTNYVCRERAISKLERSLRIPDDGDISKTEAKFANGVLSISIPNTTPNEPSMRLQIS